MEISVQSFYDMVLAASPLLLALLLLLAKRRYFKALTLRVQVSSRPQLLAIRGVEIIGTAHLTEILRHAGRFLTLAIVTLSVMLPSSLFSMRFPQLAGHGLYQFTASMFYTLATGAFVVILYLALDGMFRYVGGHVRELDGTLIRGLSIDERELISSSQIVLYAERAVRVVRFVVLLLLIYLSIPAVLSHFQLTRNVASRLIGFIATPVVEFYRECVAYIPSMFFILISVAIAYYMLKVLRVLFDDIRQERIVFGGFRKEWADTTYSLVRICAIVLLLIVIYPYLPGAETEAFKGISIFVGVLFSLGSTAVVGNAVAGFVLTYTNAFMIGDRIKVGDVVGDVLERGAFVTRIVTIKNEVISIPNSSMLGSNIVNFSMLSATQGLILHSSITLGYDLPWRKVHETLKRAALATPRILGAPEPFVLQTSLDDHYVSYQINAYTDTPGSMASIYSELHQNIQDHCARAGIEILSPQYLAVRDGNAVTIPRADGPEDTPQPS